jgi:hypothetical protein
MVKTALDPAMCHPEIAGCSTATRGPSSPHVSRSAYAAGMAFISANPGAIELIGMIANGVQHGVQTLHYYWIGAVPAMVFLGIVMMPFYYGSKARSVPEFLASGSTAPRSGSRACCSPSRRCSSRGSTSTPSG